MTIDNASIINKPTPADLDRAVFHDDDRENMTHLENIDRRGWSLCGIELRGEYVEARNANECIVCEDLDSYNRNTRWSA